MRTLFLTAQVPWPLDVGSKIRTFNLLQCYAELGPVTLACLADDRAELSALAELGRRFDGLRFAVLRREAAQPIRGKLQALREAANPAPRIVRRSVSPAFLDAVAAVGAGDFDVVHVQRAPMAEGLVRLASAGRGRRFVPILDMDDLESKKAERAAAIEPVGSARRYVHLLESRKLRAYENRIVPLFEWCLVCSSRDALEVQARAPSVAIRVFPNGADVEAIPAGGRDDGRTLTYLGAMNYPPNEDAVLYFAREVLPLVRERVPDVTFVVAGKSPSPAVRSLDDGRHVRVTGYVEDKAATLASSTVVVVPLRVGGGTRIKILEAMAAAKPVVSTSVGREGIDAADGREIVVADDARSMASACVELLLDADRRAALGSAGRALVLARYDWSSIRKDYCDFLRQFGHGSNRRSSNERPARSCQ